MSPLRIFQIDAFTDAVFGGNPAAVVPLDEWLPDGLMQSIAAENNLAETAFFVPEEGGYRLRWFTPAVEVPLCGHATLASAHVVFTSLAPALASVEFRTRSGVLTVRRDGDRLAMDFPRYAPVSGDGPPGLAAALRAAPAAVFRDPVNLYAVFDTEAEVRAVAPDMGALARIPAFGVAVTSRGDEADFVSRYFAPGAGIPEDPVTGSTHCALIPYWAGRLGKARLDARQVSVRGGEIVCEDRGDRVTIAGRAVQYLEGRLTL